MILPVWSIPVATVVGLLAAGVLLVISQRFARVVDRLADRTGMGEALAGAVLLGATTSLPGLVTTGLGAVAGNASFAVSNAVGGIAAQTMFLALGDLTYRHANLEHAAASVSNILQALLLIALAALVFVGVATPELHLGPVHAVTPLLPITYIAGLALVRRSRESPMWTPRSTRETRLDEPEEDALEASLGRLWGEFFAMACFVAGAGFLIGHAGLSLVDQTGAEGSLIGGLGTSVATSLPELVTVLAALRIGALTMAVGDILGGNAFDVLFVFAADLLFVGGPVYAEVDQDTLFLLALTVLMTAILAAGLVVRSKRGIGFEGVALLVLYGLGAVYVAL